ncbi:hypothetical protein BGZ93_001669 [Podila epicladia]|nr:hypothetical protein BGZ93_001669 [Podila epicladia]KAG0093416.1 hypothetical protein BGZ92_005658 [Podila epicladia]
MDFSVTDSWIPRISSNNIVGTMISIPGIILPITNVRSQISVWDNGIEISHFETPFTPATVSGTLISTTFDTIPLTILSTSHEAFSSLITTLVTSHSKSVTLEGSVDIQFQLGFLLGSRTLSGIGFKSKHVYIGLNGLPDIHFVSLVDKTKDDANKKQTFTFKINIESPSNMKLKLGDVVLNAAGPIGPIGTTTLKDVVLDNGDNIVTAVTVFDLNLAGAADFVSGLEVADGTLSLSGFAGSSHNEAIIPGLQALRITLVVPKKFTAVVV